ncbi:hypothetical protein MXZ21_06600 [Streptococcus uberis]|uniref:hypothetical protein n=1 Tax=Streptococcus uberis TaxID=1349 RepID=UPI001FF5ADF9|nr:hypothetical protein [Streptococcus uberis]MCK1191453.1 hypothetical protein [Streptococcus uberis]MCK1209666.1 hypothetical protein [Streptococcus uberis]
MIKEKYLKPLEEIENKSIRTKSQINFLKSASDEELHDLGMCIKAFYSPYLERNHPEFWEGYAKEYNLNLQITSKDKIRTNRLFDRLDENPNLTVAEFLKTQRHV